MGKYDHIYNKNLVDVVNEQIDIGKLWDTLYDYNPPIVDVYIKTQSGVTVPLNIKGRLYSMLVSHSNLDDEGNIFQLYFSGSELEIDLENYKEVNL